MLNKSLSPTHLGLGFIFLGLAGYGYYALGMEQLKKKAEAGDCGCKGKKRVVKEAPPPDSFVILDGGCEGCKPQAAVYNPIYINPIFDPDGYQFQDLNNMAEPIEPLTYSPYSSPVQRRSFLISNLGGGF